MVHSLRSQALLLLCAQQGLHLWQQPARHQLRTLHHPSHSPTSPAHLSLPRSCIPKNCPGADWRVLEEIVKADPSREKFKVGPHTLAHLACYVCPVGAGAHLCRLPVHLSSHPLTDPNRPPPLPLPPRRASRWCRGACPTRRTGTTAGAACLAAWTGKATSPPPPPTRSPWARSAAGWVLAGWAACTAQHALSWVLTATEQKDACAWLPVLARCPHRLLLPHSPTTAPYPCILLRRWARCSTRSRTASCRCASAPAPRCVFGAALERCCCGLGVVGELLAVHGAVRHSWHIPLWVLGREGLQLPPPTAAAALMCSPLTCRPSNPHCPAGLPRQAPLCGQRAQQAPPSRQCRWVLRIAGGGARDCPAADSTHLWHPSASTCSRHPPPSYPPPSLPSCSAAAAGCCSGPRAAQGSGEEGGDGAGEGAGRVRQLTAGG